MQIIQSIHHTQNSKWHVARYTSSQQNKLHSCVMNKFVLMVHFLFMGDRQPIDGQARGGSRNRRTYHFGTLLNRRLTTLLTTMKIHGCFKIVIFDDGAHNTCKAKIIFPTNAQTSTNSHEKVSQVYHFPADFIPVAWAAAMPNNARSSSRP